MGNQIGITAAPAAPTPTSSSSPPRSASPSAASGTPTSYSASSSASSPSSLLSTNSASQIIDREKYEELVPSAEVVEMSSTTAAAAAPTATTTTSATNATQAATTTSTISNGRRLRNTPADRYYEQHQKIPLPAILHDNLERLMQSLEAMPDMNNSNGEGVAAELDIAALSIGNGHVHPQNNINSKITTNKDDIQRSKRVLVIGDVHGCITELHNLVEKATTQHNSGLPFAAIVIVGDLCNKGPHSTAVIRHVRTQPNWFSIRGNNEDRALTYALTQWEENDTSIKQKYKWIAYGDDPLSDEDVEWMANLPYTITIPKSMFDDYYSDDEDEDVDDHAEETNLDCSSSGITKEDADADNESRTTSPKRERQRRKRLHDDDILIVHAGLDSRIPNLENQDINTMINIRDVQLRNDNATTTTNDDGENNTNGEDENGGSNDNNINSNEQDHGEKKKQESESEEETTKKERTPWAKLWRGPQLAIFGHDARRGLQTEEYAIGLDSGCCYGRELTGIILPEGEYVSVEATKVHCPFKKKKK